MDAKTVADDVLKLAKRRRLSLTPMQLMKLVYISYGWYRAIYGGRLFEDRIEAWKYGPVIPNLYHITKRFGRDPIPHDLVSDAPLRNEQLSDFLDSIVKNYGSLTGVQLSNLTHREDTPWKAVYRPGVLGIEIPDHHIADHYQKALNAGQSSAATA